MWQKSPPSILDGTLQDKWFSCTDEDMVLPSRHSNSIYYYRVCRVCVYHEMADSNKVKVVTDPFTGREPVGETHLSVLALVARVLSLILLLVRQINYISS